MKKERIKIREDIEIISIGVREIESNFTRFRAFYPSIYFDLLINHSILLNISNYSYNITLLDIIDERKANISLRSVNDNIN